MNGLIILALSSFAVGFSLGLYLGLSQNKHLVSTSQESCKHSVGGLRVTRIYRTIVAISCDFITPSKTCLRSKSRCMFSSKYPWKF